MKKILKAKFIILAAAFVLMLTIVFVVNIKVCNYDDVDVSGYNRYYKEIKVNNNKIIDKDRNDQSNIEFNFRNNALQHQKKELTSVNNINKTYNDNPVNIKLKALIEEAVRNVEGLPQYIWEPVRFNENDINEQIARLEKIVIYSNKVKSNNDSIDDKRILSELISREIKDKIEYFKGSCANVLQMSVAKNEDDQRIIDDSFSDCNDKMKELEDKLNEYENAY